MKNTIDKGGKLDKEFEEIGLIYPIAEKRALAKVSLLKRIYLKVFCPLEDREFDRILFNEIDKLKKEKKK